MSYTPASDLFVERLIGYDQLASRLASRPHLEFRRVLQNAGNGPYRAVAAFRRNVLSDSVLRFDQPVGKLKRHPAPKIGMQSGYFGEFL